MNGAAKHHDGIRSTKVAPRVTARAADRHFKAAAAKSLGNDCVGSRSVEHHTGLDRVFPFGIRKNVAHATQIALALLANVTDEQQRSSVRKIEVFKCPSDCKKGGDSGRIIGNAGAGELGALLPDVERGVCGKDGIQMGTDGNHRRGRPWIAAKNVADAVLVDLKQSERTKALRQPVCAGSLTKRGGRNAGQFELPARELRLLVAEPLERSLDFCTCGQAGQFLRDGGSWLGGSARNRGHGISVILQPKTSRRPLRLALLAQVRPSRLRTPQETRRRNALPRSPVLKYLVRHLYSRP